MINEGCKSSHHNRENKDNTNVESKTYSKLTFFAQPISWNSGFHSNFKTRPYSKDKAGDSPDEIHRKQERQERHTAWKWQFIMRIYHKEKRD